MTDTITIPSNISAEFIAGIIDNAHYSAISHWGEFANCSTPYVEGGPYLGERIMLGSSTIEVHEKIWDDCDTLCDEPSIKIHLLDRKKIEKALVLMQQKHPRHFTDILIENDDVDTADVLIQLAVFDEVIYG